MAFWVILVLAVGITVWTLVYFLFFDDLGGQGLERLMAPLAAFLAALISGLVGGGILLLLLLIPGTHIRPHQYALASLGDTQGVTGRFYFLGSGTVNGTRELTYVKQLDGYSVATEADGDASRIYQDATSPTVTEYEFYYSNGWVLPWDFTTGWSYDFHVPKGTILNDYQVGVN